MTTARATVALPRRRSLKRRRKLRRWLIAAALVLLLLLLAAYYIFFYRRQMAYVQYPLKYEEMIVDTARDFGLEPWHVAAVVRCESSFRDQATSQAGARGLMQIMPDTGAWIAGKFDEEERYTADDLYQPQTNLKYGCWYLRWLMERYGGDRALASAAYHAGQGTVDGWLADPRVSGDGHTLDQIPYDTTGTYVRRVMTACEMYQKLYDFGEETQS